LESSWRLNVLKEGLGDMGITLCTRFNGFFPANYVLTNQHDLPFQYIAVTPPDTDPDVPYGWLPRARPAGNFPYGYDVPPDMPV
jgi:hypothetical protein